MGSKEKDEKISVFSYIELRSKATSSSLSTATNFFTLFGKTFHSVHLMVFKKAYFSILYFCQAHVHTNTNTHICTRLHSHIFSCTHTDGCTHRQTHIHTQACTHSLTHARTHTLSLAMFTQLSLWILRFFFNFFLSSLIFFSSQSAAKALKVRKKKCWSKKWFSNISNFLSWSQAGVWFPIPGVRVYSFWHEIKLPFAIKTFDISMLTNQRMSLKNYDSCLT